MGRKSRLKRERRLLEKTGQKKSRPETSSSIEKLYLIIIKWGVYFILFIPLIVRKEFIFPFVFPKSTIFQVTVEIIFAFWILLAWRNPRFRPHFGALGKALALFIGINIVASIAGVDFLRSFWSTQERMTGIFALLHLFAFFTILITVFKTSRAWKRLFDLSIIAAILVGLYALGQKLGLEFLIASGQRLTGTIGNPSFLASWLLFGVFLSLWGIIRGKWIWRLVFYLPSFVFISVILIFTGGRGPFFAFGLGLFLFALALAIFPLRRSQAKAHKALCARFDFRKLAIVGLLIVIILGAGLFLARNTSWIKSNPYLNRYTSVSFQRPDNSIKARYIVWDMAFKGWAKKPLLGWGPENFNAGFNEYLEPQLAATGTVWYDRVHNIVLDTVNTTGVIGLLSYLGIFVVAIWMLIKAAKVKRRLTFSVPIIILVCYFLQNFFVFDMVNTYIMFFLLLSFIGLITAKPTRNITRNRRETYQPTHWGKIVVVGILVIVLIYAANIRPAQASFYGIKGGRAMLGKNYTLALKYYEKAFSYKIFTQGEVAKEFTKMLEKNINNPDFAPHKEKFLKLGIKELEEIYEKHPNNVTFPILLGKLYNLGSQFDTSLPGKAEIVIAEAIELSPKRQTIYWLAGQNKLLLAKNNEAVELFKKALYLNPERLEKAKAFWFLGVALNSAGKYEEAMNRLNKAKNLGYSWNDILSIRFLAEVYIKTGNTKKALEYYKRALKLEPENISIQNRIKEIEKSMEN